LGLEGFAQGFRPAVLTAKVCLLQAFSSLRVIAGGVDTYFGHDASAFGVGANSSFLKINIA
jgi:hypothetical protein